MTATTCRERIATYLRANAAPFTAEHHRAAFTAQEVAAREHVSGKLVAKAVMVRAGERLVMVVLPAPSRVPLAQLSATLGVTARLASEAEFAPLFPDCEAGAVPPFGNLYGVPVYVHAALARQPEVVLQPGRHDETFRLRYADFARLVQPTVLAAAAER
jgi:Ala-tRNA(Pro) deacylase